MKSPPKTRQVFPENIKNKINEKLQTYDNGFFVLCMTTYFCLIRNTELAKLRVRMVNLEESSIFLPKEISKNKKDEFITIPAQFSPVLKKHIGNSSPDNYLFSADDFNVGTSNSCNTKNCCRLHWKLIFIKCFLIINPRGLFSLFHIKLKSFST